MTTRFAYTFRCLDRNGSGRLDPSDFVALGAALEAEGPARGTLAHTRVERALHDYWALLSLCVDAEGSGTVDLEGFVLFQGLLAEDAVAFGGQPPPVMFELLEAMFGALDRDGDGRIDRSEYAAFLRVIGSSMDPGPAFARLDRHRCGALALADLAELLVQYFTDPDPDVPGAVLLTGGWP